MKIILRIDTDDSNKLRKLQEELDNPHWVLPQGDHIKVFVIKDDGEVTELK